MKLHKKNTIAIATIAVILMISCIEKKQPDSKLTEENPKEISKDSLEKFFAQSLYDIERNLEIIQEKEGVIVLGPNSTLEKGISVKEKIIRNIQMVNSLMEENKKKLKELENRLNGYKTENSKLRKLTENTKEKLQQYEQELIALKKDLEDKKFEITDLNVQMGEMQLIAHILQDMVDRDEKELSTAYYICGTYKELEKLGVLTKTGGFLRMGRVMSLNNNFDEKNFTEIDIQKTTSIPVHSKKAKLITDHPVDSYSFKETNGQIASLEIKDPEIFWKISKYMVVETK